jgi:hypothetical protein
MLWFFGLLSLVALSSIVLLWRREAGPNGHGLELARTRSNLNAGPLPEPGAGCGSS